MWLKVVEIVLVLLTPLLEWLSQKLMKQEEACSEPTPKDVLADGLRKDDPKKIAESFARLQEKERRLRAQWELAKARREKDNAETDK